MARVHQLAALMHHLPLHPPVLPKACTLFAFHPFSSPLVPSPRRAAPPPLGRGLCCCGETACLAHAAALQLALQLGLPPMELLGILLYQPSGVVLYNAFPAAVHR